MSKKEALEVSLSTVAAIGGTLAACGGFVTAFLEIQRLELEKTPAIHLACRPEFRLAEIAQNIKPPDDVFLMTEKGGEWVHVGGTLSTRTGSSEPAAPNPFARCEVKNFGQLPILDIRIPVHLRFFTGNDTGGKTADTAIEIPGLSVGASYEFSMLNGERENLAYTFAQNAELVRVDRGATASKAPLFLDERTAQLETHPVHQQVAAATASRGARVVLRDFAFHPAELTVRTGDTVLFANEDEEAHAIVADDNSFASGPLDPRAKWQHAFPKPGRYTAHCDYHPYMHFALIVK